jgi:hypothetical protein
MQTDIWLATCYRKWPLSDWKPIIGYRITPISCVTIDGKVCLVRSFVNKRTNHKLPFTRWANGKRRKIAWASIFRLKQHIQYIYIYTIIYIYIYIDINIYIYIYAGVSILIYTGIRKTEVGFPWWQTINGNWRLLFQQTSPLCV